MKKLLSLLSFFVAGFIALPVSAISLGTTVDTSFGYASVIGFGTQELRTTIFLIVNILMSFLGILAVLIVLYGGFLWMTAAGNEEQVERAKKLIIAGIIGLAIIFASFAIATFVVNSLVNATT